MKHLIIFALIMLGAFSVQSQNRPRVRDAGIKVGVLPPGPLNAITDVNGVLVGHTTLIRGDNVRTGVTAILPHGGNLFREKVTGAVFVGNGFGKLAGSTERPLWVGYGSCSIEEPLTDLIRLGLVNGGFDE